jgi:hypothetical protein
MEPEDLEFYHEWLQLIQMEKAIEEKKNLLWGTGAQNRWNPDEDHETFWKDEENFTERNDHLDDGDLEYINGILNSFTRNRGTHKHSNNSQLESFTPEDALARALTSSRTPSEFNLKFNQNSTTRGSEEDYFSCFQNVEEEGTSELGDYFSDDEEDDTGDTEDLTSESNTWSHTQVNDSEESFTYSQSTLSEWDPVISGLETINKAKFEDDCGANELNHFSGLAEETKLAFSTWLLFIPPSHAFRNCAAPSRLPDFLSQASSSQEPTLTRISSISNSTKRTPSPMTPTSPRPVISLSQQKNSRRKEYPDHSEPPPQLLEIKPCKPFYSPKYSATPTPKQPFFTNSSTKSASRNHESPDHPEPSKRYQPWKPPLRSSKLNQNHNTRSPNMPQETNAGNANQVSTHFKSRISLNTKYVTNTAKTKSWERKSHKFSIKTPIYRTKLLRNTRHRQRNSRRTQLWLWSQGRSPPICSLNTARTIKKKLMTCLHGENPFSKRRSESESYNHHRRLNQKLKPKSESENRNEKHCQNERQNFKSENKNKNKDVKDIKVKNEEALTKIRTKMTAKVDEVKALERTGTRFRIDLEKQLNKKTGSELASTLPPHFTTMFNRPVFVYLSIIFTFFIYKNFISIFNSVVSDLLDHHFQTFTIGDFSDCKMLCLSQQTASVQAKTLVKALANPDSIRLFKVPETRPDLRYRNLSWNPFVSNHLRSGRVRKSETNLYHDSFQLPRFLWVTLLT